MRRLLAIVACCSFTPPTQGEDVIFPDGSHAKDFGGLMIIRQGNQTTVALGGVLFPRKVKVTAATSEGPIITRFTLPSFFQSPTTTDFLDAAPASLRVEIPDTYGVLYLEGELLRSKGTSRQLVSPLLSPGTSYPIHLRAVFQVGDRLLIEDKQIVLRSGESTAVTFDGSRAISVALPRETTESVTVPRRKMD